MLGKWAWHQVHGADGIDSLERPAPVSGLLAVALWYPDSVGSIADPSSAGYPLDACDSLAATVEFAGGDGGAHGANGHSRTSQAPKGHEAGGGDGR